MACKFVYKNGKIELEDSSWESLVQSILGNNQELTLNDILIDSLAFFNADGEAVTAVMQEITSRLPTSECERGVTEYIKNTVREINFKKDEEQQISFGEATPEPIKKAAQSYIDYRADFGSQFHNCIDTLMKHGADSQEYQKALENLWKVIERGKSHIDEWTKSNLGFNSLRGTLSFLQSIHSQSDITSTLFKEGEALDKVLRTLKLNGLVNVKTEVRIEDKTALGGKGIVGIIDAVTWDNEGNITIWDFKTTSNEEVNYATKLYRYTQLRMYKAMLIKQAEKILGRPIPADKIQIKTLQILDFGDQTSPKITVKELDPVKVFGQGNEFTSKAEMAVQTLYPYKGKTISTQQENAKRDRIAQIFSPIISELGITKLSKESQMAFLEKRINESKPTFLYHIQESQWKSGTSIASWTRNGDIATGYDANHRKVIEDTIEHIAEKEAEALLLTLHLKTRQIASALNMRSYSDISSMFPFDAKRQRSLLLALEPYLSEEYEYQQISFLEDNYNIITLKDRSTNSYTFLVVSNLVELDHSRQDATNLLSPVFTDLKVLSRFKEAKNLPFPNAENLLTLLAMIAINECKDLITDGQLNLDRILVVSAASGVHTRGSNIGHFTDALKLLEYQANNAPDTLKEANNYKDLYSRWNSNIYITDPKQSLVKLVINRISTFKLTNPETQLDGLSSKAVEITQENIQDVIDSIEREFSNTEYLNLETQIGRIYAGLKDIKLMYQSGEIYDKLYKHNKYGLTAAETLGAGIDLLKYAESRRFSFNGLILHGMAQGLETSVSYSNPDQAIRFYEKAFRQAARQVTMELMDIAVPFNNATKKFLQAAGKSQFAVVALGTTTSAYEQLFELDNKGVAKNMQLKNPYSSFSELADFQREYAKEVLWTINRLRMSSNALGEKTDEYKKMSYSEFEKTEGHRYYVELINNSPEYLEMPLKLRNSTEGLIANFRSLFDPDDTTEENEGRVKRFCRKVQDRWEQSIQPVLLTPDQRTGLDNDIDESKRQFEYHSPYNKQGENRIQMLNNTSVNEWEKNLNVLTLEYACAQFKEVYFQQVLHTVGNLLGEIDLMEAMTGKDLNETREALLDRLKISVYNKNLVPDELKTVSSVVAGIKQVVSFTKLALRPVPFIKEIILGVIRNSSSIVAANFINDVKITPEDLMKAAGIVYSNGAFINEGFAPEDEKFGDFRLVGALNNLYRINDRDLNLLGESVAYDSHGIMHWGSRMLYLNTTAPDWFNRMTLLVAKMIADGTWEAHSLDPSGKIIYDPFKDKRFSRFLSFYRNHEDLRDEPTDEEYVLSKARYTLTIEQLKREGFTNLTASDAEGYSIIPICYTQQEMDSVKEQIGMLYGYYSHEERTILQKSTMWLLHTQFLTYLPGEIRKYFAPGNIESSVGKVIHLTDPYTGKKLYYHTNEAGLTEIVSEDELTYDQKTRPVLEFTNTPVEGLLISTMKTMSQVWHGDRENIPVEQLDRTKLFLFNMLLWALIHALFITSVIAIAHSNQSKKEQQRQIDAAAMNAHILRSVASELNVFGILESSVSSMGITGYDLLKSMMSSTMNIATSDSRGWFDAVNQLGMIRDFEIH